MKKVTLSALAAVAVAGTSFAGPCPVVSKDFKQPCTTPCFRDQEFQLDLFYSYNDAQQQGTRSRSGSFTRDPESTPLASRGTRAGSLNILNDPALVPAGSIVETSGEASAKVAPYFRDGSGGGLGLNYFFARYFGIGVEGNWWDGCRGGFNGTASATDLVIPSAGTAADVAAAARAAGANAVANADGTVTIRRSRRFGRNNKTAAQQVTGSLILRYPFEGTVCWAPYIFGGGGGIFDGKSTGFGHVGLGAEWRVTPYMGFFSDWRWEFTGGNTSDNGFRDSSRISDVLGRNITIDNKGRNDVSVTRVGVRFVF